MPQSDQAVQLDAQDVVNAYLQQIVGLIRRNAELEALVTMQRRMLEQAAEMNVEATPHPKPRAVGGD